MTKTRKSPLTQTDIENGYQNEGWLGWGYLGGREHLTDDERAKADAIVLAYANEHRWTEAHLFEWLNSRPGRHFADDPFGRHAVACLSADLSR